MKSFMPIDLERRGFTGLRCGFLLLTALAVGGSPYALSATAFRLWRMGFLLLPNGLLICLSAFAKDNTLRSPQETGQAFGLMLTPKVRGLR